MEKQIIHKLPTNFEDSSHKTSDGVEFWLARELQDLLGYDKWDNFKNVISKAKTACETSGQKVIDHFADIGKKVSLGSGIRNLTKYVKVYSDAIPELIEEDIFKIIIPLKEQDNSKSSEKSSEKILNLMKENNKITIEELSEKIGISTRAIEKNISKLKQEEKIKRLGSDKGGYWEVEV